MDLIDFWTGKQALLFKKWTVAMKADVYKEKCGFFCSLLVEVRCTTKEFLFKKLWYFENNCSEVPLNKAASLSST